MFRKLVSNLPYSPALVGQLGFYAKRLKKEETTRRLGLIFTALALVVQSFAVLTPPESANASNPSDLIYGGITTKDDLLAVYDRSARGSGDYKDIADYAGITRAEIVAAKETSINSQQYGTETNAWLSWGRSHRFSDAEGEVMHTIPRATGSTSTVYSRPLWRFDSTTYTEKNGSTYKAFVGYSAKIGNFAILKDCGNIVTRSVPKPSPEGAFVKATCETIRGYAFDGRNKSMSVSVLLYFNGPPGRGEKVGPVTASGADNSFSYTVPAKYRTSKTSTTVWAVLVPLPGWNESSVQFKNTVIIPGNCVTPNPSPVAVCNTIRVGVIERTKFAFLADAYAANGASISGYTFVVKDASGKVVSEKNVATTAHQASSGTVELKSTGDYTVSVVAHTSTGDKGGPGCVTKVTVASQAMCIYNATLPKTSEDCKPCPGNTQLWIKDADCTQNTTKSKEARNLTQNAAAASVTAQPGDRIQYTIYLENIGKVPASAALNEDLDDVIEYATIQDNGGGTFDNDGKVLSWGNIALAPGERQSRSFVITVKDAIPATPKGTSEPSSYDCVMTNAFGNTISIKVNCPDVKAVEGIVTELPSTGAGANVIFSTVVISVAAFLWARSRQLGKEVRLIRKDFNMGTI